MREWTPFRTAVLMAIGFALGFAHEQLSGALIFGGLTYAALRRDRIAAAMIVPLGLATLIMLLAPGNAVRAAVGQHGLVLAPLDLLQNSVLIVPVVWNRTLTATVAGFSGGAILATVCGRRFTSRHAVWNWGLVMLSAAIGATLPLSGAPDFAIDDVRTGFFPAAFVLASTGALAFLGVNAATASISQLRAAGVLIATSIVAAYFGVAANQISLARELEPERAARWTTLINAGSSDVVLAPFVERRPDVINMGELSQDPTYWANVATAAFFGTRSVRMTAP
jgi:hypothetical protein